MTAPASEDVKQDADWGNLLHVWCLRCVPPAPTAATAYCGYKATTRNTPPPPNAQRCVVCMDLRSFGCAKHGSD